MLRFRVPVHPDVDGVTEAGEKGAHFFADHKVWKVSQLVQQLQTSVNRVMVGDGDQIHAPQLCPAVDLQGLGIAVAGSKEPQVFCRPRVPAVHVQVSFVESVQSSSYR